MSDTDTLTSYAPFSRTEHFNGQRGSCKAGCASRCFLGKKHDHLSECPNYTVNQDYQEPEAEDQNQEPELDMAGQPFPEPAPTTTPDLTHGKNALTLHLDSLVQALDQNTLDLKQAAEDLAKATANAQKLHDAIASVQASMNVLSQAED